MARFAARRLLQAVLVLLVLAAALYAVFYLAPGDAARLACGPKCSTAQVQQVRGQMGLDDPVYVQFLHFLQGIVAGHDYSTGTGTVHCAAPCLGQSYRTGDLVTHIVAQKLPATASLALGAMVLWLVIGIGTGLLSALRRGTVTERLLTGFTLVGTATPVFITGIAAAPGLLLLAAVAALPDLRAAHRRPAAVGVEPAAAVAGPRPRRGGQVRAADPQFDAGDAGRGPHPHLPRVRRPRGRPRPAARAARRPHAR